MPHNFGTEVVTPPDARRRKSGRIHEDTAAMRAKPLLRLRSDGTFTIVQFTDIHWNNGEAADEQTRALMERVMDAEQPDLVLLTGDLIEGSGARDPAGSCRAVIAPMEARGIPWAAMLGNHDDEGDLNREQLMAVLESGRWSLSQPGPGDVSGVGNYLLPVRPAAEERPALALYCLDSNSYAETPVGGYGWIRRDQIAWYAATAQALRAEEREQIPALAFFHMPLPEYDEIWHFSTCHGYKQEPICCPRVNTGFFAALLEAGDVMGTFVGHDHINDFEGELHGIRLCYGRASGYQTYGREGFLRGARVIHWREGERTFRTWLRLEDGSVLTDPPRHEPEYRRSECALPVRTPPAIRG